ncbi:MAG: molybdopterin biosynthesis protein MoeA [Synergistaceae bacterium]|nr:molybdopterin biosynthesis protein MoeA [Synergistaceae bacterium]
MVRTCKEHVSLPEARKIILEAVREAGFPEVARIPAEEGLGFLLAEDVLSRRNVPHYAASAVDGFALKSAETGRATPATVVRLPQDRFLWVNTGGPLPDWCDSVVMVEDTAMAENGDLLISKALPPGANVRPVGEDVMKGQVIAHWGERVDPPMIALLLGAGIGEIPVFRLPRCLFIPTGDEIFPVSEWLETEEEPKGKVPETNSALIKGIFKEWGLDLDIHPVLPDAPDLIKEKLKAAAERYDLVLIGAGTAKGKRDHTADVIASEGEILFRWVRMKPGRPALFGRIEKTLVFGIPGFPMSAAVAAWSLVAPATFAMSGVPVGGMEPEEILRRALRAREELRCEMMLPHSSPAGTEEWLRVKAVEVGGRKTFWILSSGASTMGSMHEADGYVLLPSEKVECPKGTGVNVWFKRTVPWSSRALFQGSDDPAFTRIVTPVRKKGADLAIRSVGSLGGLAALARGEGHLAACHLLDGKTGRYNDAFIEDLSNGDSWVRKLLYYREQGFLVAKGNPMGLSRIEDLAEKRIRIVNRQAGAGTRILLDWFLLEAGLDRSKIAGYATQAMTHLDAASRVASGVVDAALGIRAAADAFGLDFVTMAWEPFELVIPEKYLEHPGVRAVLESIRDPEWRSGVEAMGGYRWPD